MRNKFKWGHREDQPLIRFFPIPDFCRGFRAGHVGFYYYINLYYFGVTFRGPLPR